MSVRLERPSDGIVVLTLDDPDRRNAMTVAMGEALQERSEQLAGDDSVRAIVLTGTPPAFSAGGDLGMLEDHAQRARDEAFDATATMRSFYDSFLSLRALPVPVIAAINGHAIGAGLCVALACDLRLVAEDAKVGLNFSRLGLHPGMGGTWLLPRIIGQQQAAAWLYTGAIIRGDVAASQGLALEAVPADEVLARGLELAGQIASASPVVIRQLKRHLRDVETLDLDGALDAEAANQAINYASDDLREGLSAVRERRDPTFSGR